MSGTIIAADLGSACAKLCFGTKLLTDETRAALAPDDSSCVLAVGEAGRRLLGAAEVYPIRGGVANIALAALMLRRFALRLTGRRSLFGLSVMLSAPDSIPRRDREALIEVGREAGFRQASLISSTLSGAVGAGLDIDSPKAGMIVDIGREKTAAAVIANGGIVAERVERTGSAAFDRRLQAYFASEHRLLISSRTAERLKTSLSAPVLRVSCREASSGLPVAREFRSSQVRRELGPCFDSLSGVILRTLDQAPPEAVGDLVDNGVTLIGGGAALYGLEAALEERLQIPVRLAQNPAEAIAAGMRELLDTKRGRIAAAE